MHWRLCPAVLRCNPSLAALSEFNVQSLAAFVALRLWSKITKNRKEICVYVPRTASNCLVKWPFRNLSLISRFKPLLHTFNPKA